MVLRLELLLVLVVVCTWVPIFGNPVQLTKFINNNNGLGKYSFEFETSDGSFRREDGGLLNKEEENYFVVRGEYGYFAPNGRHFVVQYVADDNGFRPQTFTDDTRFNDRRIL